METKLFESSYKGNLGVTHLPRFWSKVKHQLNPKANTISNEWTKDLIVLDSLNLGTLEPLEFICSNNASLEEFENWVLQKNNGFIEIDVIEKVNKAILFNENDDYVSSKKVLKDEDIKFFKTHGYVVVKNVISQEDCKNTIKAIGKFVGFDLSIPSNWYKIDSGFWIKMYKHDTLTKNRNSEKIRIAYEQLLESKNIFCSHDRVSINPPETKTFKYSGSALHWDVSLDTPMPFGLQGLLYLTDVKENGGAFSCVPGFHKKIDDWLKQFDDESEARNFDLNSLGVKAISANAGDFIIWDDRLPHGASPNRSDDLRIVQYINFYKAKKEDKNNWK